MANKSLSVLYATLIFTSCIIQGFSLPQQRISADEFARKFGSAPYLDKDISNDIEDAGSPVAKEEGGLTQTLMEIALKFLPAIIDTLSGSTGPSQTDRIEGIDLNGEDPFSARNILYLGLKLFLAVAGGNSSIDKSDSTPIQGALQGIMEAVISALTGSEDRNEVTVMAKQATEVINLVVTLVEALTTSMSQRRSF